MFSFLQALSRSITHRPFFYAGKFFFRIEAQQLAKIYSLLKKDDSNMTIDDIRGQMSMYKTSFGDVGREDEDDSK